MTGDILFFLGLNPQDLVAGCAGGISISLACLETAPYKIVRNTVIGMFLANWFGAGLSYAVGTFVGNADFISVGMADFFLGLGGTSICQGVSWYIDWRIRQLKRTMR